MIYIKIVIILIVILLMLFSPLFLMITYFIWQPLLFSNSYFMRFKINNSVFDEKQRECESCLCAHVREGDGESLVCVPLKI